MINNLINVVACVRVCACMGGRTEVRAHKMTYHVILVGVIGKLSLSWSDSNRVSLVGTTNHVLPQHVWRVVEAEVSQCAPDRAGLVIWHGGHFPGGPIVLRGRCCCLVVCF